MGGVCIDRDGQTNLEGLYAAGEDAAGVHGANRLGGNGVAESTVYGARVGEAAARWVKTASHDLPRPDQIAAARAAADRFLEHPSGENPFALREELGKVMWDHAGIVRDGVKLALAIQEISTLRERATGLSAPGGRAFNLGWQQALDLRNLLTASYLIARSALTREDSRGAHYRDDFPDTNNLKWLGNIHTRLENGEPAIRITPVKLTRLRP
jgi:succinate dehydrogenase / fumarate reductase flavoprotein subunit/fumarate reductase flavoprotein subunit